MQDTGKDLDSTVAEIMIQLQQSVDTFHEATRSLLALVDNDQELKRKVMKYIELLQFNMSGHYSWA